jgi:hypothetical protein
VLANAKFYSINFSNQTASTVTTLDDMVNTVGGTTYWTAATSEYGVHAGTAATPIHLAETAPTTITDQGIESWLKGKLDGTHPEFGTPNSNTLYIIFYPQGTTISLQGQPSCTGGWGGYHSNTRLTNGTLVAYAVVPSCDVGVGVLPTTTGSVSHEMIEAATDPFPQNQPAYSFVDQNHLVWEMILLGEVGDMCAQDPAAFFTPPGYTYRVQRTWSNVAAAAGHDPCQPSLPNEVYFNAVPQLNDTVTITVQGQSVTTKGVQIAVGQNKTIGVDLFSDAARNTWSVTATDLNQMDLSFSWSRTSGNNGDTLNLTITRNRANAQYGATPFAVVSYTGTGQNQHYFFGIVGN